MKKEVVDHLMKYFLSILIFNILPIVMAIGQETDEIICPVTPNCYFLEPSSKIPPLKSDGEYFGKVYVEIQIDTVKLKLINPKFVFVKLRSSINSTDSHEIRLDKVTGNKSIIEGLRTDIIDHDYMIIVSEQSIIDEFTITYSRKILDLIVLNEWCRTCKGCLKNNDQNIDILTLHPVDSVLSRETIIGAFTIDRITGKFKQINPDQFEWRPNAF